MPKNDNTPYSPPASKPNIGRAVGNNGSAYGRRIRSAFKWSDVPRESISDLVVLLADNGYGLVLGRTTDGGALSITILDGDNRTKEWPSNLHDYEDFIDWVTKAYAVD